jgi:predicted DCC family thiol-disulfide oxidoreductase YuxK
MTERILLFDGVCNLCNGAVQFVINRDERQKFRFASLQSEAGQDLLRHFGLSTQRFDSFVLIEGERFHTESTAALRVAKQMGGGWPLLYAFIIVPAPIRNAVYRFVARNRYRWFGRKESCAIPTPGLEARFLG